MSLRPVQLPAGQLNTSPDQIAANVRAACARQLPQAKPYAANGQRIAIVGGGPSLESTLDELRAQTWRGDKVVAVNGAYHWLMARGIHPANMVLVDARPFNARFVQPPLSTCKYFLSSQCAPESFAVLAGHDVTLFHSCGEEAAERPIIEDYFDGAWHAVQGSTVMVQAITLMRMLGFLRMDLYGFDSCWLGDQHHGYAQAENDRDQRLSVWSIPTNPRTGERLEDQKRLFHCAPWHMKQLEDFQKVIAGMGSQLLVDVHGDGLIAHTMRTAAALAPLVEEEYATQ